MNTTFSPLNFQPRVNGGHMGGADLRNMREESLLFCPAGSVVRVRENAKGCRTSPHWGAWDCHFKAADAPRGKCFVTLVHLNGTKFT